MRYEKANAEIVWFNMAEFMAASANGSGWDDPVVQAAIGRAEGKYSITINSCGLITYSSAAGLTCNSVSMTSGSGTKLYNNLHWSV